MAEAVVESKKVELPPEKAEAAKKMLALIDSEGEKGGAVIEGGEIETEAVVEAPVEKPPVEKPPVEEAPVEQPPAKPLPGEEEDLNAAAVEEEPPAELPVKDKLQWKHTKFLEKETQRLREENARLQGRAEATPAPVAARPETAAPLASVEMPANVQEQLKTLDAAYEAGTYPGSFVDYTTARAAIVVQDNFMRQQAVSAVAQKRNADTQTLNQAVDKNLSRLPGLREALATVQRDPVIGNDSILAAAVMSHLNDGGMDVVHYIANHPEYKAQIATLPADEKGAELVRLRLALTRPRKPVIKPVVKPTTQIQNSQVAETKEDADSGVYAEMKKIRR